VGGNLCGLSNKRASALLVYVTCNSRLPDVRILLLTLVSASLSDWPEALDRDSRRASQLLARMNLVRLVPSVELAELGSNSPAGQSTFSNACWDCAEVMELK
jgi:hypothetical protein